MFRIRSITTKLLAFVLAVGIVPIFLIGFFVIRSAENAVYDEIGGGLLRLAEAKEGQILTYFYFAKEEAADLAEREFIRSNLSEIINNKDGAVEILSGYLREKVASRSQSIIGISIVKMSGEVVASSIEGEIGKNDSDQKYFKEIIGQKKDFFIDPTSLNSENFGNHNYFAAAVPLAESQSERLMGAVKIFFKADLIYGAIYEDFGFEGGSDLSFKKRSDNNRETYLVNADKKMFVYPVLPEGVKKDSRATAEINTVPVNECFNNGKDVSGLYKNYRGEEVIGLSRCFKNNNWVLIIEADSSKAFSVLDEVYYQILLTLTIFFLIVIGVSLIITSRIKESVGELVSGAEKIAKGNLDSKIDIQTDDEMELLADSFNKMAVALKKSRTNIEKKVEERTREFENINKHMVGRELKMIELKEEIKKIKKEKNGRKTDEE